MVRGIVHVHRAQCYGLSVYSSEAHHRINSQSTALEFALDLEHGSLQAALP